MANWRRQTMYPSRARSRLDDQGASCCTGMLAKSPMSKNQLQAKNDKPPARCTNPGRTPQAPYQPFPALSDEEFAALKASIKAEGRVLHAIIKDEEGRILDGHHRWGAWEELRAEGCTIPEPRIE